jgi:hypothetical protein
MNKKEIPSMTIQSINSVENYFKQNPAPSLKIKLSACELVTDPQKLVETYIATCKAYLKTYQSRERAKPYWERLIKVGSLTRKYYLKLEQDGIKRK